MTVTVYACCSCSMQHAWSDLLDLYYDVRIVVPEVHTTTLYTYLILPWSNEVGPSNIYIC